MKLGKKILAFLVTTLMVFGSTIPFAPVAVAGGDWLSVSTTLSSNLVRTYNWTISKTVTGQSTFDLFPGETATANYAVTATKSPISIDSGKFSGTVKITNTTNDWWKIKRTTKDLKLVIKLYKKTGSGHDWDDYTQVGDTIGQIKLAELGPGNYCDYPYEFNVIPENGATYRVWAEAQTDNWPDPNEDAEAQAKNISINSEVNKTVTVTDSFNGGAATTLGTPSDTTTTPYTYPRTISGTDSGSIPNTAKIIGDNGVELASKTVNVTVNRSNMAVSTTAAGKSYTRTYTWDVTKTVDQETPEVWAHTQKGVNYTVKASVTHEDSNVTAEGTLSFTPPIAGTITSIKVTPATGTADVVFGTKALPRTVPANEEVSYPFTASLTDAETTSYTVVVVINGATFTTTGSIAFSGPTTEVNNHVKIKDSLKGELNSDLYASAAPWTTTYEMKVGPYTSSGTQAVIPNTVSVVDFSKESTVFDTAICAVTPTVPEFGTVHINKVVGNYTGSMSDFQIHLIGTNNDTTVYDDSVSVPANGGRDFYLPLGHYTVSEVAPAGFELISIDPTEGFSILENGSTATVTVTNRAIGSIRIEKHDSKTGLGVPGAHFKVYTKISTTEDVFEDDATTDINGDLLIEGLPLGVTYYAKEIAPAPGYNLLNPNLERAYTIVTPGATATAEPFVNDPIGSINVIKAIDYASDKKNVFKYTITSLDNESYPEREFTIEFPADTSNLTASHAEFDLPYGTYRITETPADGYRIDSIGMLKGFGQPVSGDPYSYDVTIGGGSQTPTTDTSTLISETPNYDAVVRFENKKLYKIGVLKIDKATEHPLPGAVFVIYENGEEVERINTGSDGRAISKYWYEPDNQESEAGSYSIQELTPPLGYTIDNPDEVSVHVTTGRQDVFTTTFTDTRKPVVDGSLLVQKFSSFNKVPVAGVQFQLLNKSPKDAGFSESNIVTTGTTNSNGQLVFDNLPIGGTYWVREIQQAPGYDIDKSLVLGPYTIGSGSAYAEFVNNPLGKIGITKYDAATVSGSDYTNGTKLAGAVYGIYASTDYTKAPVARVTTSASGSVQSGDLPFGGSNPATYYVKEITAPAGYALSDAVQTVSFTAAGQVVELSFTDERGSAGTLIIKKVDSLDDTKTLEGATFALYSDEALTVLVGTKTTGADGIARFDGLKPGGYWIVETVAPTDYDLMADKLPVTVTNAADPEPITIADQYNPPEDISTGMMDWNILLIGGLALLAGLLLVVFNRRRHARANVR